MKCFGICANRVLLTVFVTVIMTSVGGVKPVSASPQESQIKKQITDDITRQISRAVRAQVKKAARKSGVESAKTDQTLRKSVIVGTDNDFFSDIAIGVWGNPSYTNTDISAVDTETDTDTFVGIIGGDALFGSKLLAGVALSGATASSETEFPLVGGTFTDSDTDVDTVAVSPYLAFIITPNFTIDGSLSFLFLETDTKSVTRGTGAVLLDSTQDSEVRSASVNISYFDNIDKMEIAGVVGWSRSITETDETTPTVGAVIDSSGSDRTLMTVGAEVGYPVAPFFTYIGGTWEHSFNDPTSTGTIGGPSAGEINFDHSFFGLYFGIDYTPTDQITGTLEFNTVFDRADTDIYGVMLNVRYDF